MWEIIIIAVGVSMDAFAVAVCKGFWGKASLSNALLTGLYFGGFQALMPALGYLLGSRFQHYIEVFDHWIAFLLLTAIGINMLFESGKPGERMSVSFSPASMIPLALSTSVDALAVGITLAITKTTLSLSVAIIGGVAFFLSVVGILLGGSVGEKYRAKAECLGGFILIFMGTKILFEHLGVL